MACVHGGRTALILCGSLLGFGSAVWGDETLTIKRGDRVRIVIADEAPRPQRSDIAHDRRLTGKLLELSDSLLTIEITRVGEPVVLPRQDVASLAVSLRRDRRGLGALIGLGVGVGAGVLIGQSSGDDEDCLICFSAGYKAFINALFLAPVGALIGAVAAPAEEWLFVPVDRVRFGFDAGGRGPAISVAMRF